MSKWNNKIARLVLLYAVIICILAIFMPRPINWQPSFSELHNIPYGGEALKDNLSSLFDREIQVSDLPFYNLEKEENTINGNIIIITQDFKPDSLDLDALYKLSEKGRDIFIAAVEFDINLLDTLGLSSKISFNDFTTLEAMESSTANLSLESSLFSTDSIFSFKAQWSKKYFEPLDSVETEIYGLGKDNNDYNFVKVSFGDGNFILHNFPFAFTNYYLLKEESRPYLSSVFSVLPQEVPIIWDEYYKPGTSNVQRSPLSVLLKYPSFRWAYWLLLIGIISYILFFSKRKQRMIPVISPPKNENVKFVETLGSLYYNKGSHKDIFEKRLRILKEDLNRQYYMRDLEFNEEEAKILSAKSGKSIQIISHIFEMINNLSKQTDISDGQLKVFIKKLNTFYDRKISI
jgi:hypothetical protein